MRYIVGTFVLSLLIAINASAQVPAQVVPVFAFKTLNKTAFSNTDLQPGKLIFLVFFDADCDHCQRAIQYIGLHYHGFKKAAIYLITLDSVVKIRQFMNKYGSALKGKSNVAILRDTRAEFIRKFGPRKYPSLFLYSEKRELMLYDDNESNLYRFESLVNKSGK